MKVRLDFEGSYDPKLANEQLPLATSTAERSVNVIGANSIDTR